MPQMKRLNVDPVVILVGLKITEIGWGNQDSMK